MAQNYTVNYNIKVHSATAIQAIDKFVASTNKLTSTVAEIDKLTASLQTLTKKAYKLSFNVGNANRSLDSVIRRLKTIQKLAAQTNTIQINQRGAGAGSKGNRGSKNTPAPGGGGNGGQNNQPTGPQPKGSRSLYSAPRKNYRTGNYAYKALGPSMIDSGGIMAVDMLKGMGIMYGITGLGSMMSNVIKQSAEYDNLIQGTRNILSVHYGKDPKFNRDFANMEKNIRNVGMETKFTAPEVADASKFLAMAGLDLPSINNAIRPIADIALIGDTDLGMTADFVTNIMTGFEIPAERMRNAADVMVSTFTSSNTTLIDLAEAYKYAGSILTNSGVDFETASGALGILGNAGRKGSLGGTDMRMMMQNLLNPTKKQAAMWEEVGVNRYDTNGNLRPINEIFGDLAANGATSQQIMAMFRTTTAPSAINLMRHVDDWNEIIDRNRNSSGLSERLAEEKKNTIQGLWAQVTSVFTEDGLEAFEGLQDQIRKFLREILTMLQDPKAAETLKTFGSALLDLLKMIKEFTQIWVDMYNRFGGVIQQWIKFQLVVSTILVPLRAFRGLLHFGAYIGSAIRSIGALAMQVGNLRNAVSGVVAQRRNMTQFWASLNPGGATNLGYIPAGGLKSFTGVSGRQFQNVDREWLMRYQTRVNKLEAARAKATLGIGAGGMLGAGAGAWLGSNIGESGSLMNTLGIVGGTVGGMAAGSYVASALPGMVSSLFAVAVANPITAGIALVGAAVAGGAFAWKKYNDTIEEGKNHTAEWIKQMNDLNIEGIDVTKKFGLMMAYARVESSGLSEDKKDELRQRAWNRYYDAGKSETQIDNSQAFQNIAGGERLNEYLKAADQTWDKAAYFMGKLEHIGMSPAMRIQAGEEYKDYFLNGTNVFPLQSKDGKTSMNEQEALRAAMILAGYDMDSPLMSKIGDVAFHDIYSISRSQDLQSTWDRIHSQYFPTKSYTYADKSVSDFQAMPFSQIAESSYYQLGLDMAFRDLQTQYVSWQNLISAYDAGTQITAEQTQQVLFTLMDKFFNPANGVFGTETFNQNIKKALGDPSLWKMSSANEVTDYITTSFSQLLEFFNLLDVKYKPLFAHYLNRSVWEGLLPKGTRLPEGGYMGGDAEHSTMFANGKRYTWKTPSGPYRTDYKTWVADDGSIYVPTDAHKENQGINFGGGGGKKDGGKGTGTGGGGKGTGADSSQYKNHYTSQNAAPKQVIVRIGNLMNVQSVDLTNKDNAMVIDNLKGQLTQALVDVVHDFDESWNG